MRMYGIAAAIGVACFAGGVHLPTRCARKSPRCGAVSRSDGVSGSES